MMRFVAKQNLAIFEPDADDSQPMTKGVAPMPRSG
jgi:hypothetical protein